MAGRPAMLEGSLLARKGDAVPVIPDDSPLTESLEAATSEVVPLHRVVAPADAPVREAPPPPPVAVTTQPGASRRRVMIILAGFLVLCLIAFALAARGTNESTEPGPPTAAETGALTVPVPDSAPTGRSELSVATRPGTKTPPTVEKPASVLEKATATVDPLPIVAALKKPRTVTPVMLPVPRPKLYMLQFASVGGKRRAFEEVVRLQKRLGGILGGRKITVSNSEVAGRKRYRLRAGSFGSLRKANSVCRRVARFDVDCLAIRR